MAIFKNLEEKVVVTKGHLLAWRAFGTIFAGNSIILAGMRFEGWFGTLAVLFGALFDIIGLVMLLASYRHVSIKPASHI
ncbi:hypothetical protein GRI58_15150 [Porphyrobacter algicida]|uniref:Uncharacterized protein n=1 Tax=Qipengyuania algicida TaxID=1836209 RepID=A0A845AMN2_9SPHN|nr:hypothetical protein [Qipengyuania algicida]MXP30145.1 hypothetical protein [Qipengyuania algicida]